MTAQTTRRDRERAQLLDDYDTLPAFARAALRRLAKSWGRRRHGDEDPRARAVWRAGDE